MDDVFKYARFGKQLKKRRPEPLWGMRIIKRVVSLLDGPSGVGKSQLILHIANEVGKQGLNTLYFTTEDDGDYNIAWRMDYYRECLEHTIFYDELINVSQDTGIKQLKTLCDEFMPSLVIFDPITNYLGDFKIADGQRVRALLNSLEKFAKNNNCGILIVRHFKKDQGLSISDSDKALGSTEWRARARSQLIVRALNSDIYKHFVLLRHQKCNYADEEEDAYYTYDNEFIEWVDAPRDNHKVNYSSPFDSLNDLAYSLIDDLYNKTNDKTQFTFGSVKHYLQDNDINLGDTAIGHRLRKMGFKSKRSPSFQGKFYWTRDPT